MGFGKLLSVKDAAEAVYLKRERLKELTDAQLCPHYLVDGQAFYKRAELEKWVSENLTQVVSGKTIPDAVQIIQTVEPGITEIPVALIMLKGRLRAYRVAYWPPCVYFLVRNGNVVYVGKTTNLQLRIAEHAKNKEFDGAVFLPCPEAELERVESLFIKYLQPRLNQTGVVRYTNDGELFDDLIKHFELNPEVLLLPGERRLTAKEVAEYKPRFWKDTDVPERHYNEEWLWQKQYGNVARCDAAVFRGKSGWERCRVKAMRVIGNYQTCGRHEPDAKEWLVGSESLS